MRSEETGWDTKGPAFVVKMRGGLDAQGNLVYAWDTAAHLKPVDPAKTRREALAEYVITLGPPVTEVSEAETLLQGEAREISAQRPAPRRE